MLVIINISAMVLAALMLSWMLMRTRCHDSVGWWAFRVLTCYALVCFVYSAYDSVLIGNNLPIRYIFIRFGGVALVGAMFLSWHLGKKQGKKVQSYNFSSRLNKILKKED